MAGYLQGEYVYDIFYEPMKVNYLRAIKNKIDDDYADARLVQHIAIWYLRGKEKLNDDQCLFRLMLAEDKSRWGEVVDFFVVLANKAQAEKEGGISEKTVKKILDFWQWTFDKESLVEEQLGAEYHSFLGNLAKLTKLLPELAESAAKLLSLSLPYIKRHAVDSFIEDLIKFEKKSELALVGKICITIFENKKQHTASMQVNIQSIVRRMDATNDPEIQKDAKKIRDICDEEGVVIKTS